LLRDKSQARLSLNRSGRKSNSLSLSFIGQFEFVANLV